MKRTTARALTVATSLAVAGTVAGAGTLSATLVSASPAVEAASFTTTPTTYVVNDALAPRTKERSTFAERASRDKARKAAHLKKLRIAKQKKEARIKALEAKRAAAVASSVPTSGLRSIGKRMAADQGWTGYQWVALEKLWTHESNWSISSANSYGAYGIPQALPGSKMASVGSDWRTNPETQIEWGLNYIEKRWGTPANAWSHFQAANWY